eukprot:1347271-Amorphochlora_amoeboformis.AAC.1
MRTSWVLLCAGLAMVAGVWQKTNEGLAAEVQHQKQRSKHTILVEGPGHTEKEVIMVANLQCLQFHPISHLILVEERGISKRKNDSWDLDDMFLLIAIATPVTR